MPSFRPLYHWEGVVEEVTGETFRARLLPFEHGLPMRGKVEFTEFRFDELSEESDRALVEAGAVFSWTIAQDVSLVRFHRLPPPGIIHKQRARRRAQRLLESLNGETN